MSGSARRTIKPGKASLVGGVAVGLASFVLWAAVAHEIGADTVAWLIAGLAVAAGVATWIRVADL
jgi:hypothetical protein